MCFDDALHKNILLQSVITAAMLVIQWASCSALSHRKKAVGDSADGNKVVTVI